MDVNFSTCWGEKTSFVFLAKKLRNIFYNQKKVVTRITKNLTNRLYLAYMTQPYVYYTQVNRSRIIQFLQTEMLFFFNFFESLLGFVSELIVFIGIYILILIIVFIYSFPLYISKRPAIKI